MQSSSKNLVCRPDIALFGRGQELTPRSVCAQTVPLTPAPRLTLTDTLETHIIVGKTLLKRILHYAGVIKVARRSCANSA